MLKEEIHKAKKKALYKIEMKQKGFRQYAREAEICSPDKEKKYRSRER